MLQKEAIEPRAFELLKAIQADRLFMHFHLAGGTGLALHLGHRLSVDLDLFSSEPFDQEDYLQHLEREFNYKSDYVANNTLKGSMEGIKVVFITHNYSLLKPVLNLENIRIYPKEDIATMKINAIAGNSTWSKDFVDLYFLLYEFSVQELLSFYEQKYIQRNVFHVLKSLNYFEEVSLSDWPLILKEKDTKWRKMKSVINKHCNEYFKKISHD